MDGIYEAMKIMVTKDHVAEIYEQLELKAPNDLFMKAKDRLKKLEKCTEKQISTLEESCTKI